MRGDKGGEALKTAFKLKGVIASISGKNCTSLTRYADDVFSVHAVYPSVMILFFASSSAPISISLSGTVDTLILN